MRQFRRHRRGVRYESSVHREDPLSGVANLFDASIVFAIGIMVALLQAFSLAQLLKFQLLSRQGVGVASGPVEIVIDGDRATAKFDVTLSDSSGRWVPGGSETYRIVSGWRREGSNWVCYNATWTNGAR